MPRSHNSGSILTNGGPRRLGLLGGVSEIPITLAAPTYSDNFNSYADGTRLVAGDPNANAGLVATNPGNLGWDALTTVTPTNARFNPIVFGGELRQRTTNSLGDNADPGTYVISPAGTSQSGDQYIQGLFTTNTTLGDFPTLAILATNETDRLELRLSNDPTTPRTAVARQAVAGVLSNLTGAGATGSANAVRMGGVANGGFKPFFTTEIFTLLAVAGRAYVRRGAGFPLGSRAGVAYNPAITGTRFGVPSRRDQPQRIQSVRASSAPMLITLDQPYLLWVPKKRALASDPINVGFGDMTFTGTYAGTLPSKMQWALYDLETGVPVKDWAIVPTADFTANAGVWSARLRAIPAGLNGRRAYAPAFRPVDATNQTDTAWQVVGTDPFFVTLNIGTIGQSNAERLGTLTTSTAQTNVDGLSNYARGAGAAFGSQLQSPAYYELAGFKQNGFCSYPLADYLADLFNLPVSVEALSIGGTSADRLGPGGLDWSNIQTQHAAVGGAYDLLYLSHGEADFAVSGYDWLTQWATINLPAYRDPAMSGQPSGTVIPLLYTITGRFTGVNEFYTDALAHSLRVRQYTLEGSVSDCYLAHSYTGVLMSDDFHYSQALGNGYNEVARRLRLTYDKVFNSGAYNGHGPVATSVSRSGAVLTVSFDLNGAASLTARNGTDQTLSASTTALTSWQVSANDFASNLTISSAVITGNTVVLTLSADPGAAVKVRNHYGLNPDISSWATGLYGDGSFIGMLPLVNPLVSN